jgi:alcohol dehydrogenase (cytochrome c)
MLNVWRGTQTSGTPSSKLLYSFALVVMIICAVSQCASALAQSSSSADVGWPMYNGGYSADRYSSLKQITKENVAGLVAIARYKLPETVSFESGPVVVGDTMYFTTATSTYAINAVTGELLWTNKYPAKSRGLGTPVRGVAYFDGRLYRGTPDAHAIALDAKTGEIVWDVVAGDPDKGEYFTVAPVVWEKRLYIGTSGSDLGAIGHMVALDIMDGHKLWNFDVVPSSGPGSETWPSDDKKIKAGGGMYSSFAIDASTGLLYISTGNPGPDFAGDYRHGDNLYTCSVVMLDAKSGALRGYHQFVPHDFHDWDIAASPVLFTSKSGHKMVGVAGKNGYLYGLNRELSDVAYQTAVTTIANSDAPITPDGTRFCPGTRGGVNYNGPAYSPEQNALYVNSIDWCSTIKLGGPDTLERIPKKPFIGSSNSFGDSDPQGSGWLTAVEADSGKVLWKYHSPGPMFAAITPTAGGVVFTGDMEGNLLALDAASGKMLFQSKAGGPIKGGVVTYTINGKQYVAIAAALEGANIQTATGPPSVVIYSLPAQGGKQ